MQSAKSASWDAQGNPCCWPLIDRMKPDTHGNEGWGEREEIVQQRGTMMVKQERETVVLALVELQSQEDTESVKMTNETDVNWGETP